MSPVTQLSPSSSDFWVIPHLKILGPDSLSLANRTTVLILCDFRKYLNGLSSGLKLRFLDFLSYNDIVFSLSVLFCLGVRPWHCHHTAQLYNLQFRVHPPPPASQLAPLLPCSASTGHSEISDVALRSQLLTSGRLLSSPASVTFHVSHCNHFPAHTLVSLAPSCFSPLSSFWC